MNGRIAALASGVLALALFLAVTPPVLGIGDPAELTIVLAVTGVPHPTGYPLYVLLGSGFVHALHAIGAEWVRAAAAWSAVGGALAAALVTWLGMRLAPADESGRTRGLAFLLPALLIVFHPVMLEAASEAEVHTWWYAWCAGAFLYSRVWIEAIAAGDVATGTRRGFLWGVLCGAGLAHHAASLLLLVPLTIAIGVVAKRARATHLSTALAMGAGALIPLASYAFIGWRAVHPAVFQWPLEPTFHSVWSHIRGAAYTFYVGSWNPNAAETALLQNTIYPLLVPGIAGVVWIALRERDVARRVWWIALIAGGVLLSAFIFNYGVPDPTRYFVPVLMIVALVTAPAFAWLERRLSRSMALMLLLAIAVSAGAWSVRGALDENRRRALADGRIRRAWLAIPFDHAVVMWWDDHVNRLKLYQLLQGERPGLYVENPNRLMWPGPRRAFHQRFGFDPIAGFTVRDRADVEGLTNHLRGRVPGMAVMDFTEVLEIGSLPDSLAGPQR